VAWADGPPICESFATQWASIPSEAVRVAIIDGCIQRNHFDLAGTGDFSTRQWVKARFAKYAAHPASKHINRLSSQI
jgi:hypothetical protein